jgi:hypothetical protein
MLTVRHTLFNRVRSSVFGAAAVMMACLGLRLFPAGLLFTCLGLPVAAPLGLGARNAL